MESFILIGKVCHGLCPFWVSCLRRGGWLGFRGMICYFGKLPLYLSSSLFDKREITRSSEVHRAFRCVVSCGGLEISQVAY